MPYTINAAHSCATADHAFRTRTARALDTNGSFAFNQGGTVVAFNMNQDPVSGTVCPTIGAGATTGRASIAVSAGTHLRRLTPLECCRLMGLPDDWLDADPPLSDSAKYRMVGCGGAVPVLEWLGRRLSRVAAGKE